MKALIFAAAAGALLLVAACTPRPAPSLAGQWQGTLRQDGRDYRTVLTIEDAAGAPHVTYYSLDESVAGIPAENVAFDGKSLSLALPRMGAGFKGALSEDGNTLTGSFSQDTATPLTLTRATKESAWVIDATQHRMRMVTVDKDVTLEVLDFGGTGRPLIFLPGLGNTAHDFDKLAAKFTAANHVYAITRRGYGMSSTPAPTDANYAARRLGQDVLAVMTELKLERPVLAGHSIAGSEMSAIANLAPDRIAGLVYLDAGYGYALYVPGGRLPSDLELSLRTTLAAFHRLGPTLPAPPPDELAALRAHLRDLEADIAAAEAWLQIVATITRPRGPQPPAATALNQRVAETVVQNTEKFTSLKGVPALAFYATEANIPPNAPPAMAALMTVQRSSGERQAEIFAKLPNARVIGLPGASHSVWVTDEARVVKEMQDFLAGLR